MFSISLSVSVSLHPIFSQEGHNLVFLLVGENSLLHPFAWQWILGVSFFIILLWQDRSHPFIFNESIINYIRIMSLILVYFNT